MAAYWNNDLKLKYIKIFDKLYNMKFLDQIVLDYILEKIPNSISALELSKILLPGSMELQKRKSMISERKMTKDDIGRLGEIFTDHHNSWGTYVIIVYIHHSENIIGIVFPRFDGIFKGVMTIGKAPPLYHLSKVDYLHDDIGEKYPVYLMNINDSRYNRIDIFDNVKTGCIDRIVINENIYGYYGGFNDMIPIMSKNEYEYLVQSY